MNQTKISVIMPSLNVSKYIKQCLQSVLNQTLEDIEIICVDGGSTDGTLDIIQQYVKKGNRVKLIHSDIKSYGYQMNLPFMNEIKEELVELGIDNEKIIVMKPLSIDEFYS